MLRKACYNQNSILWAVETNSGRIRSHNEDYYIARPAFGFWVLCDGLGGHANGALASRICAETIAGQIIQGAPLEKAIQISHEAVNQLGREGHAPSGKPCSTVAVLLIEKRKWTVAWAGDTRVWLYEKKKIRQVTQDHTVVRKLLDWGVITEEEAREHPDRNKVTKAVGIGKAPLTIGMRKGKWDQDQVFILGTDGMAFRDDPEILSHILSNTVNPDQIVDELSHASLITGGQDNFTIAVVGRSLKNSYIQHAARKSRKMWNRRSQINGIFQPAGF